LFSFQVFAGFQPVKDGFPEISDKPYLKAAEEAKEEFLWTIVAKDYKKEIEAYVDNYCEKLGLFDYVSFCPRCGKKTAFKFDFRDYVYSRNKDTYYEVDKIKCIKCGYKSSKRIRELTIVEQISQRRLERLEALEKELSYCFKFFWIKF
jgi:ribosomal protein L37E